MPTNPTPAAMKAAEKICCWKEQYLEVAAIIDHALTDERAAGDAMAKRLLLASRMLPPTIELGAICCLDGQDVVDRRGRDLYERVVTEEELGAKAALAAWRKARGQQ